MLVLLGTVVCLIANTKSNERAGREFQIKIHDINQVEMAISNYGKFGQTETGFGCWWPKGSGHNYIWGAGIWFGTIDALTGDTLVTIGYGPHGESEYTPGLSGMSFSDPNAVIFMYSENWPPLEGTFPMAPQDRISHQDSWCCYNDSDYTYHMPGDTRPIGIEVYQTIYAWDVPEIEDIIFFTHEVKNVSDHTLKDCYFGIYTDCDIGNEAGPNPNKNDICSAILGQWYEIEGESIWVDNLAFQWQEDEESGWAEFPGTIGFDLLETPFDIGMTAFKRFTLNLEPNIDAERYMTLAGYNIQTGLYEPYDTIPSDPDDQRFLMSSGPFDLAPDSSETIIFAVLFANWYGLYATSDTALVLVDKWAQYQYDNNWILSVEEISSPEVVKTNIAVSPNPLTSNAKVSFSLLKSGMVSLKLYNALGQLVKKCMHSQMNAGNHSIDLNTSGLAQGTYFLVLKTPEGKTSNSLVVLR